MSVTVLTWATGGGVGAVGAVALQAAQIASYVQRTGHGPWRSRGRPGADRFGQPLPRLPIFWIAATCKVFVGFALVAALTAGSEVITPLTALLLGAAAANLLQRAAERVSLPDGTTAAAAPAPDLTIQMEPDREAAVQRRDMAQ